jgi:hypothetical protein
MLTISSHKGNENQYHTKILPHIDLPYDLAIPLLGIYPKEYDTGCSKGTCTPMFIAVLFTIAKLWKQPRCPLLMNGSRKCGNYTQWNISQL